MKRFLCLLSVLCLLVGPLLSAGCRKTDDEATTVLKPSDYIGGIQVTSPFQNIIAIEATYTPIDDFPPEPATVEDPEAPATLDLTLGSKTYPLTYDRTVADMSGTGPMRCYQYIGEDESVLGNAYFLKANGNFHHLLFKGAAGAAPVTGRENREEQVTALAVLVSSLSDFYLRGCKTTAKTTYAVYENSERTGDCISETAYDVHVMADNEALKSLRISFSRQYKRRPLSDGISVLVLEDGALSISRNRTAFGAQDYEIIGRCDTQDLESYATNHLKTLEREGFEMTWAVFHEGRFNVQDGRVYYTAQADVSYIRKANNVLGTQTVFVKIDII